MHGIMVKGCKKLCVLYIHKPQGKGGFISFDHNDTLRRVEST